MSVPTDFAFQNSHISPQINANGIGLNSFNGGWFDHNHVLNGGNTGGGSGGTAGSGAFNVNTNTGGPSGGSDAALGATENRPTFTELVWIIKIR